MKKILLILCVLALLAAVAFFVVRYVAMGYLTPDFVARTIESRWNCRAEVGEVNISPGGKTTIEVRDVALAARDHYADDAVPLGERPMLDAAIIRIASMKLDVRPGDLMKRRLQIEHLAIQQAVIETTLQVDGSATVDTLFEKPGSVAPSPVTDEGEAVTLAVAAPEDAVAAETDETFIADDMKIAAGAGLVELRDSRITILLEKSGATVHLENLQILIKDIDVDPGDLIGHNSANFEFGGTVAVDGTDADTGQPQRFVDLKVSGGGALSPFNTESGIIEPAWSSGIVFHQGSKVETFPLVEKLQKKLADIDTGGVDLSDIQLRGVLGRDSSTRLAHRQGRFTLEQPLTLDLPDASFTFDAASWADTASNQHEIKGVVTASPELTAKVVAQVDKYIQEKTRGLLGADLRNQVLGMAMKDGLIALEFVSDGDMSKPKVDLVTPFGTLSELKDTVDDLKDAFKSLFKK